MDFNIPLEIKDKSAFPQLKKVDRQVVAYAVLFGVGNQDAFMRFHPEYLDASGKQMNPAGKKASSQFWNYGKVKDYRQIYEEELAEFLGQSTAVVAYDDNEVIDGDALARKILSDLAAMIKNGRIQDYEVLKIATDILNKYGVLKGSEEKVIAPIRVLPSRCSECRYRIGVESMVLNGQMLDMCTYCKCRKIAEEHGYRFNDGKDLLEIPQEVIADLESKNDVKLLDILDGKVQN